MFIESIRGRVLKSRILPKTSLLTADYDSY